MRNCFICYKNGEMISTFLSGFPNVEESEIIKAAKTYALGNPPDKVCRRNLNDVRAKKCKLIAVVEMLGFLGSPVLNLVYPSEINRDVEICLDTLVKQYLPNFQAQQ